MDRSEMMERTKQFALRIIRLVSTLPNNQVAWTLGKQIMRSGTSIGANYREAARASTKKHFSSILSIASREADETLYWLELLADSETVKPELLEDLMSECKELIAILTASVKTAQGKDYQESCTWNDYVSSKPIYFNTRRESINFGKLI